MEVRWVIEGDPFKISYRSERIARAMAHPGQKVSPAIVVDKNGPFADRLEFSFDEAATA